MHFVEIIDNCVWDFEERRVPNEELYPLLPPEGFVNMPNTLSNIRENFKERKLLVDILAISFGIGSWLGVNAMFNQLPLLVQSAPEQWNLPSYLTIIIQVANIGPITYSLLKKYLNVKDEYCVYVILSLGTLSMILMAFFNQKTSFIAGQEHSTALFILAFFLALVGCTSSVLFMPYMGNYKEVYLISYLIGEGLSGFLPSITSLIQGVGGNPTCVNVTINGTTHLEPSPPTPRFSTFIFFLVMFGILCISTVSFFLLNHLKTSKSQKNNKKVYNYENPENTETESIEEYSGPKYKYLYIWICIICFFGNGMFPAIQSYSCLPYGNVAYHLTVSLSTMASPIACFLAVFLPHTSIRAIFSLIILWAICSSYILSTALLSPNPPLVGQTIGEIIMVLSWVLAWGLISYIKLSITSLFRKVGGKSLFWCGAIGQLGSASGAILIFCIVNFTSLFESYSQCSESNI